MMFVLILSVHLVMVVKVLYNQVSCAGNAYSNWYRCFLSRWENQHENKANALKVLYARLYEKMEEEKRKEEWNAYQRLVVVTVVKN